MDEEVTLWEGIRRDLGVCVGNAHHSDWNAVFRRNIWTSAQVDEQVVEEREAGG